MPRIADTPLLPGQAQYVLDCLVNDGRVSPAEVARYAGEIHREIAEIEERLQRLRAASGARAVEPQRGNGRSRMRWRRATKRRGNALAGRYMGYMRQVPAEKKAKYQRLKQEEGYDAAIEQLKADLGK